MLSSPSDLNSLIWPQPPSRCIFPLAAPTALASLAGLCLFPWLSPHLCPTASPPTYLHLTRSSSIWWFPLNHRRKVLGRWRAWERRGPGFRSRKTVKSPETWAPWAADIRAGRERETEREPCAGLDGFPPAWLEIGKARSSKIPWLVNKTSLSSCPQSGID